MNIEIKGCVHSFQSLGTLDGPGVRFVAFFQGCNLRCGCCHNPDTWDMRGGTEYSASEVVKRASRYKEYFGEKGGITLSGGEPLLQAEFAYEIFRLAHNEKINTCLDTSGSILNENVKLLLSETDRALLDIKYTNEELYKKHVGCSLASVLEFLTYLNEKEIPTTLRQVIIPGLNDKADDIKKLVETAKAHTCVDKIELLPFRKICSSKYESLRIEFPFAEIPTPTNEVMQRLKSELGIYA